MECKSLNHPLAIEVDLGQYQEQEDNCIRYIILENIFPKIFKDMAC